MASTLRLFSTASVVCLLFTGCIEEFGYYEERPGYHGDTSVDFYYSSGRPYSRSYGPLVMRDNRYYYSRGGSYVVYDRPTRGYRDTRVVRREVSVDPDDDRNYGGQVYERRGYDYDDRNYYRRSPGEVYRGDSRSGSVIVTDPRPSERRVRVIER